MNRTAIIPHNVPAEEPPPPPFGVTPPRKPRKVVYAPAADEPDPLRMARLGAQGRANKVTATPYGTGRILWRVPSQEKGEGWYTVSLVEGVYSCGCPAYQPCAHIAVVRTQPTDCPACGAKASVFAPPRDVGAVYCPGCDLRVVLTVAETDSAWGYFHGCGGNLFALLWGVVRRVSGQEAA